ncbi:MAG TPA: NFACT RNA binding domain-containing protein [Pyrinomonadaceae bacterium]|nr:NFACT RNA binding domain-containing protein [Pyrinomonadaceae bacterium]
MNEATLAAVGKEMETDLVNRPFGKIFQLSRLTLAVDFRLPESSYLFISVEPVNPRVYLIKRKLRDLEKQSLNPSPFVLFVRKRLSNAALQNVAKLENERVLRFEFLAQDEIEGLKKYALIAQVTGRSASIFLLDERDFILDSLRENSGEGQEIATRYRPPKREKSSQQSAVSGQPKTEDRNSIFPKGDFATLSEALDAHYQNLEIEKQFQARAKAAEAKIRQEIARREKLIKKLNEDLTNHGDAEKWKRYGDLILANLADAVRDGDKVLVVDYFDENAPAIELEIGENSSLTEAAEKFFKRYTKARNAKAEIAGRLEELEAQIANLKARKDSLEQAIAEKDEQFIAEIGGEKPGGKTRKSKDKDNSGGGGAFKGARKFTSSDGFEILVGKGSKDNDYLTFRLAKSLDFWLHAADYGGSHVVVRNPNRLETLPPQTLLEAAEIAAFYSQGKNQVKAAVNYTQKKFVNKPKGAAAGLVSLSSFKTILVEPKISVEIEKRN